MSMGAKYTEEDLKDEDRRIKELRDLVDQTAVRLRHSSLSYEENRRIIDKTREKVVELFPGKGDLFDLIHRARFYRILEEAYFIDKGR